MLVKVLLIGLILRVGRKAGVRRKESPNTNVESDFFSPCSPRKLLNLLEILNEKQKADVGFGGLFSLNLTKCSDHRILSWLIKNFKQESGFVYRWSSFLFHYT